MTARIAYPYQDPGLAVGQRVDDLLARMTPEDKAGLVFHPLAGFDDLDAPGPFGFPSTRVLLDRRITHMNVLAVPTAREIAHWHNHVQAEARRHPLGIPITLSTDPRHHFADNPATSFLAGPFSQWPEPLGLAALRSPDLVRRFAEVVRAEYLAVGFRVALHPQLDLATEPRWARQNGTFGEDAGLATRLGLAYVRGLQGEQVGPASVSAMAKHFPGGGPQRDGEDPHFAYGREQVYPGGRFEEHLKPFEAAVAAGVAQLMPYYGMPVGTELEEVGFGFNRQVLTGLLRERLGFDGIVCTDWGILSERCWGVEDLPVADRMVKALDAGVDQFGGEYATDVLLDLVRAGRVSEARLDTSCRRLLAEKFRLGLFEDPFVDADAADAVVGTAATRAEGVAVQAAAHTLLKNAGGGPARLPLRPGAKVYLENLDPAVLAGRAESVGTPGEADVAVLRLLAPFEPRGEPGTLEVLFHRGSLAWPDPELDRVRAVAATVPTVLAVYLDRPAVLAPLAAVAAALLVDFGATDEAVAQVLFGETAPQGRLPFDLPSSMAAVEAADPDTPFATAEPSHRFGDGLAYATA